MGVFRSRMIPAALPVLASLLLVPAAHAATIEPTTTSDSPANGCTLRESIDSANQNSDQGGCDATGTYTAGGTDTIVLAATDYDLGPAAGTDEDANANGDLDVTESLNITGAGSQVSGIDGNGGETGERVLHLATLESETLTLSGLTIHDGNAAAGTGGTSGGGILATGDGVDIILTDITLTRNTALSAGGVSAGGGHVDVTNTRVTGNTATVGNAGGISALDADLTRTTVSGNTATAGDGGGIRAGDDARLTDSAVSGNTATAGNGGGISAADAELTDSTVNGNTAGTDGGGIFAGTATLTNSTARGNEAAGDGGGIVSDVQDLTNTTVSGNRAGGVGGGILTDGSAAIDASAITDNEASNGGGIHTGGIGGGGVTIDSSTIIGNEAAGDGGGLHGGGPITDTLIRGNKSGDQGAGIFDESRNLRVERSAVIANDAVASGGGIVFADDGSFNLANSTVSGNATNISAGGILAFGSGTTNLNNATIADNTADANANNATDNGGGIFNNASTVNLANTIVAENRDLGSQAPDCSGTLASANDSLIGNIQGCGVVAASNSQIGTNAAPIDPELALPAQNGGPTPTQRLLDGSPATNQGNPATPGSATPGACEAEDQRGVPRSLSGRCSIGAYEPTFCRGKLVNRVGSDGNDVLTGTEASDGILGFDGNDRLIGLGGGDGLCGGDDNDRLSGGSGNDALDGGSGTDKCNGSSGNDTAVRCEKKKSIP